MPTAKTHPQNTRTNKRKTPQQQHLATILRPKPATRADTLKPCHIRKSDAPICESDTKTTPKTRHTARPTLDDPTPAPARQRHATPRPGRATAGITPARKNTVDTHARPCDIVLRTYSGPQWIAPARIEPCRGANVPDDPRHDLRPKTPRRTRGARRRWTTPATTHPHSRSPGRTDRPRTTPPTRWQRP